MEKELPASFRHSVWEPPLLLARHVCVCWAAEHSTWACTVCLPAVPLVVAPPALPAAAAVATTAADWAAAAAHGFAASPAVHLARLAGLAYPGAAATSLAVTFLAAARLAGPHPAADVANPADAAHAASFRQVAPGRQRFAVP